MSNAFWDNVETYSQLGFDPLRWIPTCSNEGDPEILRKAINDIKRSTIKISPSWFDSFYCMDGKPPELTRRVYSFENPVIERESELKRAVFVLRVHTGSADAASLLSNAIQNFLKVFQSKTLISRISMALTAHQDAQFALLDYIELHRGDKVGYIPVNTSVIGATDVTQSPDSEIHSSIALTAAIENLNLLGCGPSSFKLFPIYDAPSEEVLDRIRSNLDSFTSRYNLAMDDYSSLKRGKLFYGATAYAATHKELPTKYDQVEAGMQIILTEKFGTLTPVSLFMLTEMDQSNTGKLEARGISLKEIDVAKDEAMKSLSEPHFSLGKIISRYCPDFGSQFEKSSHVAAVYPVLSQGLLALVELAETANSSLTIDKIPVASEEMAKFATEEFLIENATASANGCHVIIATDDVADLVEEELRKHNFEPSRIGLVSKKGAAGLTIREDPSKYIASKSKLARLGSAVAA